MPGGLWLNNRPPCIINAVWVSLIKWHGDKLMCSSEDPSPCIPLRFPENVPATPPGHVVGPHTTATPLSSQDPNINLSLSLSPRSAVVSGIQSPFAGCREEEEGFVCSCCGSIQPDSHYLRPQRSE